MLLLTALDMVLGQQFAQLKLKDSRIITLDFHKDISESLTSVKDPEQAAAEADTSTSKVGDHRILAVHCTACVFAM